jgi:hypothetical protein
MSTAAVSWEDPMRALVIALAAVLSLPALAGAQPAWAKLYDDGVKEFNKGNYALAEQKLMEARSNDRAPKRQRRDHAFSSVDYRPYIPDYYLGLIAARQGKHAQAKALLEGAIRQQLVTPKERADFAAAQDAIATATAALAPPPTGGGGKPGGNTGGGTTGGPTGGGTTGGGKPNVDTTPDVRITERTGDGGGTKLPGGGGTPGPPPPPPPPAWLAGFQQAMGDARRALGQQRYTEARSNATLARTRAGDAQRQQEADGLRREIEVALTTEGNRLANNARAAIRRKDIETASTQVAALETLSPDHPAIAEVRNQIEAVRGALQGAAALAQVERMGVKLFLSGNYKQSADELQRGINRGVKSARIYLFLASSTAAQALLASQDARPALENLARQHYRQATANGDALDNEQRFISPSILELLRGS